jgi:hypothetical protein
MRNASLTLLLLLSLLTMLNRLLLWQVGGGYNTLQHYLGIKNKRVRPFRMGIADTGGIRDKSTTVFYPNDSNGDIQGYPIHSHDGKHTRYSTACVYNITLCAVL